MQQNIAQIFQKINSTRINDYPPLLKYHYRDTKLPCLPLNLILKAFQTSHYLNPKGHSG